MKMQPLKVLCGIKVMTRLLSCEQASHGRNPFSFMIFLLPIKMLKHPPSTMPHPSVATQWFLEKDHNGSD